MSRDTSRGQAQSGDSALAAHTAEIVVIGRKTGQAYRTTVWFAAHADSIHMLTFARHDGRGTQWYRNLKARESACVEAGRHSWRVQWIEIVDSRAATELTLRLFRKKYGAAATRDWYEDKPLLPIKLRIVEDCPREDANGGH